MYMKVDNIASHSLHGYGKRLAWVKDKWDERLKSRRHWLRGALCEQRELEAAIAREKPAENRTNDRARVLCNTFQNVSIIRDLPRCPISQDMHNHRFDTEKVLFHRRVQDDWGKVTQAQYILNGIAKRVLGPFQRREQSVIVIEQRIVQVRRAAIRLRTNGKVAKKTTTGVRLAAVLGLGQPLVEPPKLMACVDVVGWWADQLGVGMLAALVEHVREPTQCAQETLRAILLGGHHVCTDHVVNDKDARRRRVELRVEDHIWHGAPKQQVSLVEHLELPDAQLFEVLEVAPEVTQLLGTAALHCTSEQKRQQSLLQSGECILHERSVWLLGMLIRDHRGGGRLLIACSLPDKLIILVAEATNSSYVHQLAVVLQTEHVQGLVGQWEHNQGPATQIDALVMPEADLVMAELFSFTLLSSLEIHHVDDASLQLQV